MMRATGINVALGLAAGYLFGAMATEVMKLLGVAVTTPWLQETIANSDEPQCGFLVIVFHMGTVAVLFAFLLASLTGPSAYRAMGEHRGEVSRAMGHHRGEVSRVMGEHRGEVSRAMGHHRGEVSRAMGEHRGEVSRAMGHHRGEVSRAMGHHRGEVSRAMGHHRGEVSRAMGEHRGEVSRAKALCLAATAALLGLMVSGATVGAIEGKMAETFPIVFIYFVIPLFQISCQMMFLTFMRFCEFNSVVQSSILAIFAVFYPSSLMCVFTVTSTSLGPGLSLTVIILLAALHLLLICPVSSGANCIPCFSLLLTMLAARNVLHDGEFLSINPNVNVTVNTHIVEGIFTGMMGTQLLAVGVGAYLLLSLDIREGGRLMSAGAVAGGWVVWGVVGRTLALLGTWGSLGALLGASGAVGC
ncbi:uncharacterized protein LOC121685568 [Alosa sapidissima]|uniref:uncharacterized protein LOC121685568 n=1 Tax=Alosa sapidissima TaxID=34773 RepID=UPI001C0852E3|nr:uncharacterized protein LOC121685568 [Alosa sapidissima]